MNNHMSLKLVGVNSSLELNSPITSIYLQEELTGLTTLPGIRETKGMNIGMNGGWTSAQFYEPRLITIKGVIANQDVAVVEQRRKQLIQLLAEKRLALEFQTEAGNHYTMDVVVAGVQMPLSKVLTASYFQLNLRADDPLIYDNNALAELEAILRRSSSASSGFTINFPINFQLGVSESRPTIDNFGSSVVYPVITLTGPLTTPEVVNITTNMAFTIDEVLSAGAYTLSGIRGVMTQEGTVDAASGSSFQITGIEGAPLTLTEITGNATQNGTPTPDTPVPVQVVTGENTVKITGKNFYTTANATVVGAQTTIVDANSYTATTTGNWQGRLVVKLDVPKNTDMHFNWELDNIAAHSILSSIKGVQTNTNLISNIYYDYYVGHPTSTNFNTGENTQVSIDLYVSGNASVAGTYKISNIQLESGSSYSGFEPYQGQEYEIYLPPDTLDDTFEQGSFNASGINDVANNRVRTKNYIPCEESTQYKIYASISKSGKTLQTSVSFYTTDDYTTARISFQNWLAVSESGATITTPANAKYMRILLAFNDNTNILPSDVYQVKLRSDVFTPIELAGVGEIQSDGLPKYRDSFKKTDGKWYIEKQIGKVDLATLTWTGGTVNQGYIWATTGFPNIKYVSSNTELGAIMATNYTPHIGQGMWETHGFIAIDTARVAVSDNSGSPKGSAYYALATPTTTEITDSTLLAQLNFIANLYGGTNNIMLVGTGAQGEIEVRTGQIIGVIDSLSIVGTSGSIDINLNGSELAAVGSVTDELAINGTTGAVTKTARIGKIASYAGETITTDYISTTGGLDTGATVYYVLPSSSTSTLSTLDSTALASFNGIVASGGVSAQTNIGSISVDVTTLSAQDVAVVDTKQHTVTINGVGAYSKFSGDWLTLDVGLNELQLITENNADTGSAVIKYRVGYMGV